MITDPNVLISLSEIPESIKFPGAGLVWHFANGTTVQFNEVQNSSLTVSAPVTVPEPATTEILILGMSLLAGRRRKK